MSYTAHPGTGFSSDASTRPALQGATWAYHLLHFGFVVTPLVAGLDKFGDYLTNWDKYLAPVFPRTLNVTADTFMRGVGIIEIIAAIIVAFKPRIGGYIVALWLAGIIFNLVINPASWSADPSMRMWDIALRDLGLLFGALCLAWLAADHDGRVVKTEG
jgi:hypothetical protein